MLGVIWVGTVVLWVCCGTREHVEYTVVFWNDRAPRSKSCGSGNTRRPLTGGNAFGLSGIRVDFFVTISIPVPPLMLLLVLFVVFVFSFCFFFVFTTFVFVLFSFLIFFLRLILHHPLLLSVIHAIIRHLPTAVFLLLLLRVIVLTSLLHLIKAIRVLRCLFPSLMLFLLFLLCF